MNELLNITGNGPLTMSSREIADLVEKRHDNVKRTIEALAETGVIARPQIEDVQEVGGNNRAYTTQQYRIGKRDTFVIVAQLSPEFTARLVDRWQELEAQNANRQVTVEDLLANPTQLLVLAQGYALQIEDLRRNNSAMKSEVAALDRIAKADGVYGVRQTSQVLQMEERKFIQWAQQASWIFRHPGSKTLMGYADKRKAGLVTHKLEPYTKPDGEEASREVLKFTTAGIVRLAKMLNVTLDEAAFAPTIDKAA